MIHFPTLDLMTTWAVEIDYLRESQMLRNWSVWACPEWTPLWVSAQNDHDAIVKLFVESSKVDADIKDGRGRTLLSWMAHKGDENIMKLLLNSGRADANTKDPWKRTPLLWAARNGHEAAAKLLVNSGAVDVNSRDIWGRTPLSWASKMGHEAIVRLLLNCDNVDANNNDRYGGTPLSGAAENDYLAIVELLLGSDKVDADLKASMALLSFPPGKNHEAIAQLFHKASFGYPLLPDGCGENFKMR